MRAPLSWLRDYVPLLGDVSDLADTLSGLGLVVEGIDRVGEGLGDVVVARVLAIRPHPNADRMRLVDVDSGTGAPVQIACGAWNFAVGDLVPLAPVGAVLPGGFEISRQKKRGEWSNGMLCSAVELELPEPADGGDGLLILPAGLADSRRAHRRRPRSASRRRLRPRRQRQPARRPLHGGRGPGPGGRARANPGPHPPSRCPSRWTPASERRPITVEAGDLCPRFTGTILEGCRTAPRPPGSPGA